MYLPALIPAFLSLLSGLGSIFKQNQSADVLTRATQPGAQPGTSQPGEDVLGAAYSGATGIRALDDNPYGQDLREVINTGAQVNPALRLYGAQLAENQRAGDALKTMLDQVVGQAQGSRLGTLSGEVAKYRSDLTERLDGSKAGSAIGRLQELGGKTDTLAADTEAYFKKVRDNPNIFSSLDIERMATKAAEGGQAANRAQVADIENRAALGGLSPEAVAALKLQAQQGAINTADTARRDLEIANAVQSAGRGDQAATTLAGLLTQIYTLGGQLAGSQGGLEGEINRMIGASFGTEAGIVSGYDDAVQRALALRASAEQPENLLGAGLLLDETNRYNTAAESGALADVANLYASIMGQTGGMYESARNRELQTYLAPSDWDKFWGGGGGSMATMGVGLGGMAGLGALGGGGLGGLGALGMGFMSSRRFKEDIRPLTKHKVNGLQPVTFRWKGSDVRDVGVLAEDVEREYPDLAVYDERGELFGVDYPRLTAVLLSKVLPAAA